MTQNELINMIEGLNKPTQETTEQLIPKPEYNDGVNVYDADTVYKDGQGYRLGGIDAPEMPSIQTKLDRLQKAKESKFKRHVSLANPGEVAAMEAFIGTVSPETSITKGLGDTATSFSDFEEGPTTIDYGSEFLDTKEKGKYGRPIVQNEAYKNKMLAEGYVAPYLNPTEEDKALTLEAMQKGKGLWGSEEGQQEMLKTLAKRGNTDLSPREDVSQRGALDELEQTITGGIAGVGQGAVELLDVAQEIATYPVQKAYNYFTDKNIDIDLIDNKQKEVIKKGIADLVGYDQSLDEASSKKAEELIDASGAEFMSPSTWHKLFTTEEGRGAIKEYLENPSLTANSLTQIFGTGGAGAVVKGGTKIVAKTGAKAFGKKASEATDNFIAKVENKLATNASKAREEIKAIKAGDLSDVDKLAAIKAVKEGYTYNKKLVDVLKGTTFTNSDFAVRVNNNIDEYKKNNNGEDPSLGKLASIVLIDKFLAEAEVFSAKRLAGISDLPKDQMAGTIKQKLFEHVKNMGLNIPMEAMQEGFDALGSIINEKYGSDKYKDKTLTELLEAESSSIISQILAGGTAGAHTSGARAAYTGVKDTIVPTTEIGKKVKDKVTEAFKQPEPQPVDEEAKRKAEEWLTRDLTKKQESYPEPANEVEKTILENVKGLNEEDFVKVQEEVTQELEAINSKDELTEEETTYKANLEATLKYVNARKENEAVNKKVDTVVAKVGNLELNQAQLEQTRQAYADQKQFEEKIEPMKNIAMEVVKKGNVDVLGSDLDTKVRRERISELVELLSMDEDLDAGTLDALVTKMGGTKEDKDAVNSAVDSGKLMKKLMSEVAGEVATGNRGFLTYYNNIRTAREQKDTKAELDNKVKMAKFIDSQSNKLARMEEAEKEFFEEELRNAKIDAKNLGISVEEVLKKKEAQYKKSKKSVEVKYDTRQPAIKMSKGTMLEYLNLGKPADFKGGIYKLKNGIKEELDAMTQLYAKVNGDEAASKPEKKEVPKKEVKDIPAKLKEFIEKYLNDGASVDEMILRIDTASKLSNETKAAAAEYARNYKVPKKEEEATPSVEEVEAAPEITAKQPTTTINGNEQPKTETTTEEPNLSAVKEMENAPDNPMDVPGSFNTPMDVPSDFNAAMDLATQEDASMQVPMDTPQDVFTPPQEEMQVPTNEVEIKKAVKSSTKGPEELKRIYEIRDELEARIDKKIVNNEDTSRLEENLNLVKKGLDGNMSALQKWIGSESNSLGRFKPWAGESNAKGRLLKDFFKVGRLTGINYREVKADEGLKKEIVELLKTTEGKRSADDGANDIGRNLLFDEKSNVNDMTVIAIDKALKNYLAENAGELGQKPEMEDMLDMLPHMKAKVYSKDKIVAFEAEQALENFFRSGGGLLKFEAEKIGADIMADLGIVAGPNTPETVVQAMKASLGGMAITLGISRGQFKKIEGFGDEKAKIPFIKVEKKTGMKWGDRLQDYKNASEVVNAQYDVDGSRKNSWKTTPNRRQREVEIKNMPYSKANPMQKNFKNDLAEMEWKPNSGINVMIEMFGKDKEGLKAILGKKTDVETKKLNFDDRSAQESKNMEVDTEVDSLFDMLEKTKTEEEYASVWFDYFLAKNGRTNMKSITVNPQTNKKLNRFLVTVLDANTEVTVAEINEAKSKKGIGFLYGIVQGFEQKGLPEIDSASQKDIIEAGKGLLAKTDKELVEMVKKSAHPGHAMLAVANIRKMREAKNGKFESDLVLETDGLTNGLFFKFLQFPTQKVMQLLDKVGILLKGNKFFDAKTMAEVKGSKKNDKGFRENGFLDMYESIGNNFVVPKLKGRNAEILKLAKKALLDMTDKKAVRQLAKSPVMVTGYSAGEESTKRNVVKERLKDFATAVTEGKISDENLTKLFPGVDVKGLLMEHSMFSKELDKVRKDMEVFFMEYYAEPIYKALEEELGELKEIGDTVTEAYNYMYKVMNLEYVKRMAKVVEANQKNPDRRGLNGLLTEQERVDLIKGMIKDKIGPFVATSETTVDEDMLVVLSRGLRDIEEEIQKAGIRFDSKELKVKLQVRDGNKVSKLGEDVQTIGIQLVMRGVGTPGAAGGVLQTHSEDNHVMARIFAKRKDKFSQVFDAQVLGIGQLDAVKSYNEEAFELNREFSMLDAVLDAMEATLKSDSVAEVDKQQLAEKSKTGSEVIAKLNEHKVEVDRLRNEIFTSEVKIGQMVGPDGLMHEVKPKEELDKLMDRKKGIAKRLEGISKYLGKKELPTVSNRIGSIMKKNGCK